MELHHNEIVVPRTYKQAVNSPESEEWKAAMDAEITTIHDRNVWSLVPPSKNQKVIGCRWVYTTKSDSKGEIVRYKARLVAQGFRQIKGETYDEVFSPVVNFTIIRLFFSLLVCTFGWVHSQLDVRGAYLYAPLSHTIYMKQPEGYEDSKRPSFVCSLTKALYGLHQSGREWFYTLDKVLIDKLKFTKVQWSNCIYKYGKDVLILIYVDDFVIFGRKQSDVDKVIQMLSSHFDIKVLGVTKTLLGIEFEQVDQQVLIHQEPYINKICNRFSKYNLKPSTLPISKGVILTKADSPKTAQEIEVMKQFPYRSVLGCLAFIASRTRPDIMFAVNMLSQFQENPGLTHWRVLIRLLGYVQSTHSFKLQLSPVSDVVVRCYSDADFASNRDDRVSMGGMIAFLDTSPVSWRTFKHKCVSLSTMESEYISLTEAAKELVWIQNILSECKDLGISMQSGVLLCDNTAAIDFSNSPVENNRTKHIDVKFHFLRNLVLDKKFQLSYVNTKANKADFFTKAVTKEILDKMNKMLFLNS